CMDACALTAHFGPDFDVIVAGEVLERIPNPGIFLDQAAKCLRPGGILVVTVPNAFNCISLFGLFRSREVVHRDHCFYFSAKTLARLGSIVGFRVQEVGYTDPLAYARRRPLLGPIWRMAIRSYPMFGQSVVLCFSVGSRES